MANNTDAASLAEAAFDVPLSTATFSEMVPSFQCESEENLARRFMRPVRKNPKLVYEFTRDPALISQYCRLYERECGSSAPQFGGEQDTYNEKSHIVVVREGNLCVGGARLTVSTPRQPQRLPLEIDDFHLSDYFPELKQKEMRYGGLSRFVLLADFRDGDISRLIVHHVYRKAIALKLEKVFSVAPLINVRLYRKTAMGLGMKDAKIHTDIQMPSYPGYEEIKGYLLETTIDNSLFLGESETNDAFSQEMAAEIKDSEEKNLIIV